MPAKIIYYFQNFQNIPMYIAGDQTIMQWYWNHNFCLKWFCYNRISVCCEASKLFTLNCRNIPLSKSQSTIIKWTKCCFNISPLKWFLINDTYFTKLMPIDVISVTKLTLLPCARTSEQSIYKRTTISLFKVQYYKKIESCMKYDFPIELL